MLSDRFPWRLTNETLQIMLRIRPVYMSRFVVTMLRFAAVNSAYHASWSPNAWSRTPLTALMINRFLIEQPDTLTTKRPITRTMWTTTRTTMRTMRTIRLIRVMPNLYRQATTVWQSTTDWGIVTTLSHSNMMRRWVGLFFFHFLVSF